ncbi:MAG: IS1634 family transposase [Dehalococcoidia bacterium]
MASLQAVRVKGHTYYRLVTCRRINGKPTPVVLDYLGKADDIQKRLEGADKVRIRSWSHGAVAALYALAGELQTAAIIDRHLAQAGRRTRHATPTPEHLPPQTNDGLTVGQSLTLVSIGRACHATSKRAFAGWARTTTLGQLAGVDVDRLSSQHFWDQMDQLPVELIEAIERDLVADVIGRFELLLDTLLFDATNFFTFIASSNTRCKLPARGKQKQKRNDLRQVSVAMLCSRQHGIPLWHRTYDGNIADSTCFATVLESLKQRMLDLRCDINDLTVVYDKGNVSQANQRQVDELKLHYVSALTVASQRKLVDEANPLLLPVEIEQDETVPAYRTKKEIWGAERTVVVLCSERLRQGQIAGVMQHANKALTRLSDIADMLQRGTQRRTRAQIQRDIENDLKGCQHLGQVIRFELTGDDPHLALTYSLDRSTLNTLAENTFGRVVLMTDRHDWTTKEIIHAYHGQAAVEALFAHLKDPAHLALRPQYHWTDQKLHVHVFTCVLGYLLTALLHLRARRANAPYASMESLLEALGQVRRAMLIRRSSLRTGKRDGRVTYQLEEIEPDIAPLLPVLKVPG